MILMIQYLAIWDTQIIQWSLGNLKVHIFPNLMYIYVFTLIHIYYVYYIYTYMSVYMLSGSRMLN